MANAIKDAIVSGLQGALSFEQSLPFKIPVAQSLMDVTLSLPDLPGMSSLPGLTPAAFTPRTITPRTITPIGRSVLRL